MISLGAAALATTISWPKWMQAARELPENGDWMPSLFVGHGSPMNALDDNAFTRMLKQKGSTLPKPSAILVISAHWLTRGTFVSSVAKPPTIHDFHGFPDNLYQVQYPSPGSPEFAKNAQALLDSHHAKLEPKRGLDHGAWSVLLHMFPGADIPVFQVSIDVEATPEKLVSIGHHLKELRKRGVLLMGSGNLVHNLGMIAWDDTAVAPDWAQEFDAKMADFILRRDKKGICKYQEWGQLSQMAHPSNDHLLPLLHVLGTEKSEDEIQFIHEGFQNGSISMRCVQFG